MRFTVLVPARFGSTRLPGKALADLAGLPMVVRTARRAALSGADKVVVACDDERIASACALHGVESVMTAASHPSGSDRLAEACALLGLDGDDRVVNVQGDEPLIEPDLVRRCSAMLDQRPDCVMSTIAHPIDDAADFASPHVVKVVVDAEGRALMFSRAPLPHWRDGPPAALPQPRPLRHVGVYGYRAGFLRRFPQLAPAPLERIEALEQLRVLWHGERIAVHIADAAAPACVDTPADLERVRALLEGPARGG